MKQSCQLAPHQWICSLETQRLGLPLPQDRQHCTTGTGDAHHFPQHLRGICYPKQQKVAKADIEAVCQVGEPVSIPLVDLTAWRFARSQIDSVAVNFQAHLEGNLVWQIPQDRPRPTAYL